MKTAVSKQKEEGKAGLLCTAFSSSFFIYTFLFRLKYSYILFGQVDLVWNDRYFLIRI